MSFQFLLLVITVGNTSEWVPGLIERAKNIKMGNGFDDADLQVIIWLTSGLD